MEIYPEVNLSVTAGLVSYTAKNKWNVTKSIKIPNKTNWFGISEWKRKAISFGVMADQLCAEAHTLTNTLLSIFKWIFHSPKSPYRRIRADIQMNLFMIMIKELRNQFLLDNNQITISQWVIEGKVLIW